MECPDCHWASVTVCLLLFLDSSDVEDSESFSSDVYEESDAEYLPTPVRREKERVEQQKFKEKVRPPIEVKVSPITLPNQVGFVELSQLDKFIKAINRVRGCTTPECKGELVPVNVNSEGFGGGISVRYACNGCASKDALFETSSNFQDHASSSISMCVQVAFIVAGCTHAVYHRTLKLALGIQAVCMKTFLKTIESMYPVVKEILDEVCEIAKKAMKEMNQDELGSWQKAVTTADGVWHTRGWPTKNATFSIRNYLTGALLYYHHLCQKGRDGVVQEELYEGTSKSAEGFAARHTFRRAKQEGMQIAVHWQDADSSSANAVVEVFPKAEVMICGGHAGRAHKKILEKRQKVKCFTKKLIERYEKTYPAVSTLTCKCKGNHSATCGCMTAAFIAKAHTNFSSILMEAKSQEEFVRRLTALPNHARDVHEWEGGQCDFHPLRVCTCKTCEDKWDIKCEGEPYKTTRNKLDCEFHSLVYEIECQERCRQVEKLVHPVLKRGHSNACEASHNVLIRFRSKDLSLERLHYHVSTNLGLLQANLTYMHAKFGSTYHWIPELYRRMHLPVFDGVVEALQKHIVRRKKDLALAKTTPCKKRHITLKKNRVLEGMKRKEWSRKHGHDTYGDDDAHDDSDHEPEEKKGKTRAKREVQGGQVCAACGSSTHKRSSHRDCPFNKKRGACTMRPKNVTPALKEGLQADIGSTSSEGASSVVHCSDDAMTDVVTDADVCECTCGAEGRAHKRNCPMSSRGRYPGRALFPPPSNSEVHAISSDSSDGLGPDGMSPPSHKKMKL